ncbi:MAG: aminoacyl-tRNA hydrolase [Candidatus Riflebacteria bacterium]|nr:aminoacyl-tRNA hydrolase [Candidatus Riflebacteria bacterium]
MSVAPGGELLLRDAGSGAAAMEVSPVPLVINESLVIPDELIVVQASRSGGPGGQNVNKVSSRVELFFDLASWPDLPQDARERLRSRAGRKVSRDGVLRLVCQRSRDQQANREACLAELKELVLASLVAPRVRRATRPSRAARARRVDAKRRHSQTKRLRKGPGDADA